jgi:phage baseplate assembly protein gpV
VQATGLVINSQYETTIQAAEDSLLLQATNGQININSPTVSLTTTDNIQFQTPALNLQATTINIAAGDTVTNELQTTGTTQASALVVNTFNYFDTTPQISFTTTNTIMSGTTQVNINSGLLSISASAGTASLGASNNAYFGAGLISLNVPTAQIQATNIQYAIDSLTFTSPATSMSFTSSALWSSNALANIQTNSLSMTANQLTWRADMLIFNAPNVPVRINVQSASFAAPVQSIEATGSVNWSAGSISLSGASVSLVATTIVMAYGSIRVGHQYGPIAVGFEWSTGTGRPSSDTEWRQRFVVGRNGSHVQRCNDSGQCQPVRH